MNKEEKWIPVKERMPEESSAVLIWCPERKNIYCAYWEEKKWWIFGAGWEEVTDDVVAWMPLPEPYKAEKYEPKSDCCATDKMYPNETVLLLTNLKTTYKNGFYWLAERYNGEIIITNEDRLSDFHYS